MSLFCGMIELPDPGGASSPTDQLERMAAPLHDKGVGAGATLRDRSFHAYAKALTVDDPDAATTRLLADRDDGIVCVGSVRLDNRDDLAATLGLALHPRDRTDDLAVVIAAYQHWGTGCVAHFYGDFAFVIWDPHKNRALCARDHIGVVPFYYAQDGNRLLFANDLACVAALKDIKTDLHRRNVADYLDTEQTMAVGETFLTSVFRLPGGHQLSFDNGKLLRSRWWDLEALPKVRLASDTDYVNALEAFLANAVRDRMPPEGAIATHVTGGLDSSIVTAVLSRACKASGQPPPHAMTWNPGPATQDEADHPEAANLDAFCDAFDLTPHRHPADVDGLLEYFSRDPVVNPPSNMLLMEISLQRAARALGCSTIFSGHGGDQGISYRASGYYTALLLQRDWPRLNAFAKARNRSLPLTYAAALRAFAGQVMFNLRQKLPFVLTRARGTFKIPGFCRFNPRRRLNRPLGTTLEGARRAMLLDGYLEMRMEAWAEHGSRRALRYAYPLLDRKLLEFALGLPPEAYIRGNGTRWLVRQLLVRYAPERVARNTNKTEPSRTRALNEAIEEARPLLAAALDAPLTRGDMVDVARLRDSLATVPFTRRYKDNAHFGRRRAALEMLDIAPCRDDADL